MRRVTLFAAVLAALLSQVVASAAPEKPAAPPKMLFIVNPYSGRRMGARIMERVRPIFLAGGIEPGVRITTAKLRPSTRISSGSSTASTSSFSPTARPSAKRSKRIARVSDIGRERSQPQARRESGEWEEQNHLSSGTESKDL